MMTSNITVAAPSSPPLKNKLIGLGSLFRIFFCIFVATEGVYAAIIFACKYVQRNSQWHNLTKNRSITVKAKNKIFAIMNIYF